ncbi:hypothetical protein [Streptodolium elevatio]|uniref:Uncharacterized protein n=1 Tax=Streptodolium elevatio TaxID=3157996 RepID=A0ABV3DDI6_9ACTN
MKLFRKFRKPKAIPSYGEPIAPTVVIQYRELTDAIAAMAEVFSDSMTATQVGPSFCCGEADKIARVLALAGHADAATRWLDGHSLVDEPGDLHFVEDEGPFSRDHVMTRAEIAEYVQDVIAA